MFVKLDFEIAMGPLGLPSEPTFQTLWPLRGDTPKECAPKNVHQKYGHQKSLKTIIVGTLWIGLGLLSISVFCFFEIRWEISEGLEKLNKNFNKKKTASKNIEKNRRSYRDLGDVHFDNCSNWDIQGGSPICAHSHSHCFEKIWGVTARVGTNWHGQKWAKWFKKTFQIAYQSHIILISYWLIIEAKYVSFSMIV